MKSAVKKWKLQCAKVSKDCVAKEVKVPKSVVFIKDLLFEVIHRKQIGTNLEVPLKNLDGILSSPKNIAPVERPDVHLIVEKRETLSRFKK